MLNKNRKAKDSFDFSISFRPFLIIVLLPSMLKEIIFCCSYVLNCDKALFCLTIQLFFYEITACYIISNLSDARCKILLNDAFSYT